MTALAVAVNAGSRRLQLSFGPRDIARRRVSRDRASRALTRLTHADTVRGMDLRFATDRAEAAQDALDYAVAHAGPSTAGMARGDIYQVGDELVRIRDIADTDRLDVERGVLGTAAAAHPAASTLTQVTLPSDAGTVTEVDGGTP